MQERSTATDLNSTAPPAVDSLKPEADTGFPGSVFSRFQSKLTLGETPRQAGLLFSAQMGSMAAAFLITVAQTKWMPPDEIGRYAFCLAVLLIASLVLELGLFPAGGRLLAILGDREKERTALGALIILAAFDALLFAAFVAAIAAPIDLLLKQNSRWLLITSAAAAAFIQFQRLVEESCQGLNQIRRLSQFQFMMATCQLLAVIGLGLAHRLTATTALLAYLAGIGLSAAVTLVQLEPRFLGSRDFFQPIFSEVRSYGLNAYLARMTATASTRLDNLVITYFAGLGPLGLYFIAQRFSSPISTMARALAITRFRSFARLKSLPRKIVNWNTLAVAAGSIGLALFGPPAIRHLFQRYAGAAPLFVPCAAYNLFQGLFQPYNMFLSSHGRGAELRNIAIATTAMGISLLFALVPRYGIYGAAWGGSAAMLLDYLLHLYYYRRLKARLA